MSSSIRCASGGRSCAATAAARAQWRGGTGVEYDVELQAPAEYSFRGEGIGRPTGLGVEGGADGRVGEHRRRRRNGQAPRTPPPYALWRLGPSRLTIRSPGGGGYGDPLDRDPARVLRDVRDEVVTPREAAAEVYGVVFATRRALGRRIVIDTAATARDIMRCAPRGMRRCVHSAMSDGLADVARSGVADASCRCS